MYFDALYCNLVEAGESGGILEALLDRLAVYQEKTVAIKNKIKSALTYPIAVMVVAFIVVAVIMIFVVPAFEDVFKSFGADLPAPTLFIIALSKFFVVLSGGPSSAASAAASTSSCRPGNAPYPCKSAWTGSC